MAFKPCSKCNGKISGKAAFCPHCGMRCKTVLTKSEKPPLTPKQWAEGIYGLAVLAFIGFLMVKCSSSDDAKPTTIVPTTSSTTTQNSPQASAPVEVVRAAAPVEIAPTSAKCPEAGCSPRSPEPETALNEGGLYRVRNSDAISCNDKQVAAEMQDATDHPGSLSDASFESLWHRGQCSPVSDKVLMQLVSNETFIAPTGPQHVALVHLKDSGMDNINFYIMARELKPADEE